MIRHYEKIGLMQPAARRDSGYRDYDQRDVHTLRFIGRARDLGFSIEEIGKLLEVWHDRDRASADVKGAGAVPCCRLRRKEEALHEMRCSLEHLAASCHGDERPDCPILGGLEGSPPPCRSESLQMKVREIERRQH